MKQDDLVSVIIPTMNRSDMLERCILSVLSGTYKNVEVIVSDDSDDDKTKEVVKTLGKRFKHIMYLRSSKKSVAAAMNLAIPRSNGKFLFLLNDDNIIAKDCIAELLKPFNGDSSIGIVGPRAMYFSHRNVIMHAGTVRSGFMRRAVYKHVNERWRGQIRSGEAVEDFANAFVFRRTVIKKTGMWDLLVPHMGEDGDFEARVRMAGYRIVINPKAVTYHDIPYNPKELYFMRVNRLRMYHGMHSKVLYEYRYDSILGKLTFTISIPAYMLFYGYQVIRSGKEGKLHMFFNIWSGTLNGIKDAILGRKEIGKI